MTPIVIRAVVVDPNSLVATRRALHTAAHDDRALRNVVCRG